MTATETELFHKRRLGGIGGSDVGAILGVDPYRDALDVYLEKTERREEREKTPDMIRGIMLEDDATQLYMEESGRRLKPGKFRRHREYDFLIGHPDRIITAKQKPPFSNVFDGTGVLEVKTVNWRVLSSLMNKGLPQRYLLQLQHYMAITGTEWGAFAILCADPWQFITFDLAYDPEVFDGIVNRLQKFWVEHVEAGVPPLPSQIAFEDELPDEDDDDVVDMRNHEQAEAWTMAMNFLRDAKEQKIRAKAMEDSAKEALTVMMEQQHGVYESAEGRIYFRQNKGRRTFQKRHLDAMGALDPIAMASLLEQAGLSLQVIEAFFTEAKLDLSQFEKVGAPYDSIRPYFTKED